MENTESLLWRYWRHKEFREPQKEIIDDLLQGLDVFAVLPTGSGKSLCYQLPALAKPGVCLVISPLIALMQDQVDSLKSKGIRAIFLNSGKKQSEIIEDFDNLLYGNYKFLYLSPEKLQSKWIQEKIKETPVSFIAIDEAHCISQWGQDFRPSYLKLSVLGELLPKVPKIAITATATERVSKDIIENLDLKQARKYKRSFERNNLQLEIIETGDLLESLRIMLQGNKEPAILYVGTRKETVMYSNFLNHNGISSAYYHGGLNQREKMSALQGWIKEDTPLMVATNAFGMGIDKSNVRKVIHCHLPQSPENYLQEIGRAGRDGEKARAVLFYNRPMLFRASEWRTKTMADAEFSMFVYQKLGDYYQVAKGECPEETFPFALENFCGTYKLSMAKCLAALGHLEQDDVIMIDHNVKKRSYVQIKSRGQALYSLAQDKSLEGKVLQFLLRNYGGILEQRIPVKEDSICRNLQLSKREVATVLNDLAERNILLYDGAGNSGSLQFLMPREENFIRSRISKSIQARNRNKERLAFAMESIVLNSKVCRIVQLAKYFGEDDKAECGMCDVCSSRQKDSSKSYKVLQEEITSLLQRQGPASLIHICVELHQERDRVVKTIEMMMEKELLTLNLHNQIELKS